MRWRTILAILFRPKYKTTSTNSAFNQIKMAKPTDVPAPKDKKSGLTLGATVGIAIAIALLVIGGALIAWIIVRRRRRSWGKKRKEQRDPESTGDSPDEEIAKKVEADNSPALSNIVPNKDFGPPDEKHEYMNQEVAEIDSGQMARVEMAGGETGKLEYEKSRPLSELHTESNVHEMPGTSTSPVEIDGNTFVAELDGTNVPIKTKATTSETLPAIPRQATDPDPNPTKTTDDEITETKK